MGAEAVREALAKAELAPQIDALNQAMTETKSKQIRKKLAKRIKKVIRYRIFTEPELVTKAYRTAGADTAAARSTPGTVLARSTRRSKIKRFDAGSG